MNDFLRGDMFGMPRWVWLTLLAGGVGVGLYWRAHNAQTAAEGDTGTDPGTETTDGGTAVYDPSQDPALPGQGQYSDSGSGGGFYPYQGASAALAYIQQIFGPLTTDIRRLEHTIRHAEPPRHK